MEFKFYDAKAKSESSKNYLSVSVVVNLSHIFLSFFFDVNK